MRAGRCVAVAAALLVMSCGGGGEAPGIEIESYFDAWAAAWSSGDEYDLVRFYEPDVAMRSGQPDDALVRPAASPWLTWSFEGRAPLADWFAFQNQHDRTIDELFISPQGATALVTIDDLSTATLVGMRMKGSLVTETWMLRWRDAHLDGGAADTRLEWVDDLVSTYLTAWAAENESAMERLYSEDAVVDLGAVEPLVGRGEIVSSDAASLSNAELAVVSTADRTGPALFVFPAADTQEIAFAVTARSGTCDGTHAILLGLDEKRRIATEERAPSLATLRECDADRLAGDGWWSDLAIPPPLEEQTDTFVGPAGDQIPIVNGTPEMERFLSWGLGRFALAGLVPLRLGSVMFAPVRACAERSGLVIEDFDADHHLVICTDPYRACEPDADACTGFTALSRFGLLHELAHVWHLNNLGAETEAVFVEFSGTESWHSVEDPWQERGAEHAAEMTAWGLMDEPVALVRLGEPACDRLARGFRILTGADPLRTCDG